MSFWCDIHPELHHKTEMEKYSYNAYYDSFIKEASVRGFVVIVYFVS